MNPVKTAHTLDLVRRARRLRRTSGIRGYVRETRLSAEQFLYPLFVTVGSGVRREVPSMPGVFQLSVDEAVRETEAARGWIDEPRIMMESLTSIARAGADIIITYYAREAARALRTANQ
jgi:delta-aminolevulinic acid dehydratase/porphobilinogen synthase